MSCFKHCVDLRQRNLHRWTLKDTLLQWQTTQNVPCTALQQHGHPRCCCTGIHIVYCTNSLPFRDQNCKVMLAGACWAVLSLSQRRGDENHSVPPDEKKRYAPLLGFDDFLHCFSVHIHQSHCFLDLPENHVQVLIIGMKPATELPVIPAGAMQPSRHLLPRFGYMSWHKYGVVSGARKMHSRSHPMKECRSEATKS